MDFSKIPTKLNCFHASSALQGDKFVVGVPPAIAAMTASSKKADGATLGADYQVGPKDVVCGRGKGFYNKPGNVRFRLIVQGFVAEYLRARTKLDKTMVLSAIVDRVQEEGRFVKRKGGVWTEISEDQAREKAGHAIREAMAGGSQLLSDESETSSMPPPMEPDVAPSSSDAKGDFFGCQWNDVDAEDTIKGSDGNFERRHSSFRASIVFPDSLIEDLFASV